MAANKDKFRGIIVTALFHIGIIILLLILGFSTSLPLPGEEGVEISLGTDDQGMGEVQPDKLIVKKKETHPPPQQSFDDEHIVTQDTEPAPVIKKTEGEKKEEVITEEAVKKEIEKEEQKVNPAALYKGKSKDDSKQINEGITGEEGDQGKPAGRKDSKNYQGHGGFGDGLSYSLSGREPKYLPKPSKKFKENGTVVVQITVDKYGKVTKAVAIDKGSNTTNTALRRMAEEAAKKSIFNAKPSAPEIQRGTITYHFIVKN